MRGRIGIASTERAPLHFLDDFIIFHRKHGDSYKFLSLYLRDELSECGIQGINDSGKLMLRG
jgi:hypothetical protein